MTSSSRYRVFSDAQWARIEPLLPSNAGRRARPFEDNRRVVEAIAYRYRTGGACADDAAMESSFSLLQKNVLNRKRWTTRQDLRLAVVVWIEKTYHRRRRQDSLGRLTPIEYEPLLQTAHAA